MAGTSLGNAIVRCEDYRGEGPEQGGLHGLFCSVVVVVVVVWWRVDLTV